MNWYLAVLKKYAVFSGRAQRAEYWFFTLFNIIITIVLAFVDAGLGTIDPGTGLALFGTVYALGVLIPGLAVSIRRLHDTNRSGWWLLIGLIPLIGLIVLIVFMVQDSDSGDNQHGANPKAA